MARSGSSTVFYEHRSQLGHRGPEAWLGAGAAAAKNHQKLCTDGGRTTGLPVTEQPCLSVSRFRTLRNPCTDGGRTHGSPLTEAHRDFLEVSDPAVPEGEYGNGWPTEPPA